MNKILTITLNPALDKSIVVPALVPEKKMRCLDVKVEPGGGGINVSRALHQLGGSSEAVFLSGGFTGKALEKLLTEENINHKALPILGDTRENFIVLENAQHLQYRFGMEGPPVTYEEWMAVLDYVAQQDGIDYIIASGSLPPGVPVDFFARLATIAKEKKARLIADTSGAALKEVVAVGLFMIKPNQGELSSLYGEDNLSADSLLTAARSIIQQHGTEAIVISLGAAGAFLVTAEEHFQVKPPTVTVQSTVGAGDSMVAGMIWALSQNWDCHSVLRYGVAAGTAATLNRGTELCQKADTDQIYAQLKRE